MCCSIVKVSRNIGGAIAPLAPPVPLPMCITIMFHNIIHVPKEFIYDYYQQHYNNCNAM